MTSAPPITRIILNAGSGGGTDEADLDTLRESFVTAGHDVRIDLVRAGDDMSAVVQRALADGPTNVVAGGGDGTINSVAQHLVGSDVALGVLPMGTLNHFARDLGIPLELRAAAAVVTRGYHQQVDVGEVNGRIFLNNSSLGLYPRIVQLRERYRARGVTKWVVAAWAALRVVRSGAAVRLRMTVDGEPSERRTPLLFIGNGAYLMEGFDAGTRESITAGYLALYTVHVDGTWPLLRLVSRILRGRARASGELTMVRADHATIHAIGFAARSHVMIALDGEVETLALPLDYRSKPGALRVCVPHAETANGTPP